MFGLITGSGFYDLPDLENRTSETVATPFGPASITVGLWRNQQIAFVPRHGSGHRVPPAKINARANIWALREIGVEAVLATAVSGAINRDYKLGSFIIISDVLNFTSGRADTFFDGESTPFDASQHHVDMTRPYSPMLRQALLDAAADLDIEVVDGGVYCTTNGPRFETPAEIEMMRRLGGDLVGMTGYPEVVLANEAGLSYASVGIVSNPAASPDGPELTAAEVFGMIQDVTDPLQRLIEGAIAAVTD